MYILPHSSILYGLYDNDHVCVMLGLFEQCSQVKSQLECKLKIKKTVSFAICSQISFPSRLVPSRRTWLKQIGANSYL